MRGLGIFERQQAAAERIGQLESQLDARAVDPFDAILGQPQQLNARQRPAASLLIGVRVAENLDDEFSDLVGPLLFRERDARLPDRDARPDQDGQQHRCRRRPRSTCAVRRTCGAAAGGSQAAPAPAGRRET